MIYVTHDQIEAMTLADRIVVMKEQKIQQIGSPDEIYRRPANLFVAGFVGSPQMNFIKGRIEGNGERPELRRRRAPPLPLATIGFASRPPSRARRSCSASGRNIWRSRGVRHLAGLHGRHRRAHGSRHGDLVQRRRWLASGAHQRQPQGGSGRAPDARRRADAISLFSRGYRRSPLNAPTSRPGRRARPLAPVFSNHEDPMSVTDILSIQLYTLRSLEDLDRILDTVAGCRLPLRRDGRLASRQGRRGPLQARCARPQGLLQPCQHGGSAREARGRRRRLQDPRPHASLHAGGSARSSATWPRMAGARSAANSARWRSAFRTQGIRLGYHNHHWELKPKDGAKTALELIFEAARGKPPRLAGRRGLARARRCRSQGMDRPLPQQGRPPPM